MSIFATFTPSTAQTLPFTLLLDSLSGLTNTQPRVRLGTDKIANTLLFRGEFGGVFVVPLGILLVRSQYRGSTIRSGLGGSLPNTRNSSASRDDADVLMRYTAPLDSTLSFVMLNNFALSQDSRSIGLNRSQILGVNAGLEWQPRNGFAKQFDVVRLAALFGGEYNEQLGVPDRGWTFMGAGTAQNLRLDDYALSFDGGGFSTNLSNNRTNTQWNARLNLNRTFEGGSQLDISTQYTTLQRDFYTSLQQQVPQGLINSLAIETRSERLLRINGRFAIPIVTGIDADVSGFVENWAVGRQYRQAYEKITITAVQRDVDQLRFSLSAIARATFASGNHSAGITFDSREEANAIRERFSITDNDLQTLRAAERQRDNVSLRTTLWWQTAWNLFTDDTLRVDYSTSLLRYDTPSSLNNDDRDELATQVSAAYTHVFSHILSGTILADVRLAHLVFIKAQRSAQNNWNRVLRLVPSFRVASGNLLMHPQFEILANYTSFDFEDLLGTAQSFSLRQVAYRDSINITLGNNARLESRVIFRYFERGEFRWREFSETPRDRNIEAFVRILCVSQNILQHITQNISQPVHTLFQQDLATRIGVGARVYVLTQSPSGRGFVRVNEFVNQSFAPETVIDIDFRSGTTLRCNAWLEFQFDKTSLQRIVPNFLLSLNVQL